MYFDFTDSVKYEGAKSKNPFAFKFYDKDRVILGKKMSEHLPFAMAWWHSLCAAGTDMFGRDNTRRRCDIFIQGSFLVRNSYTLQLHIQYRFR